VVSHWIKHYPACADRQVGVTDPRAVDTTARSQITLPRVGDCHEQYGVCVCLLCQYYFRLLLTHYGCFVVRNKLILFYWMGDQIISRAPPCFGRHVKPLVSVAFAVISTHLHWARVVGYGPFSLCEVKQWGH
jgi:hypothetical protein